MLDRRNTSVKPPTEGTCKIEPKDVKVEPLIEEKFEKEGESDPPLTDPEPVEYDPRHPPPCERKVLTFAYHIKYFPNEDRKESSYFGINHPWILQIGEAYNLLPPILKNELCKLTRLRIMDKIYRDYTVFSRQK